MYQGAFPSPEMMREYGEFNSELPDRLVSWVEQESLHRREIDKYIVKHYYQVEYSRTIAAIVVIVLICATGITFLHYDHAIEGASVIGIASILVGILITRSWQKTPGPGAG